MNTPSAFAKNIARTHLDVLEDMERFYDPYVKQWLEIELAKGKIDQVDADRHFSFEDFGWIKEESDALLFASEDWEERWAYGGFEQHYGTTICIPLEFFDNPNKYLTEVQQEAKRLQAQTKKLDLASKRASVARIEAQLAQAKADLEKEEKDAKL